LAGSGREASGVSPFGVQLVPAIFFVSSASLLWLE
jgi:hypothetical protein